MDKQILELLGIIQEEISQVKACLCQIEMRLGIIESRLNSLETDTRKMRREQHKV